MGFQNFFHFYYFIIRRGEKQAVLSPACRNLAFSLLTRVRFRTIIRKSP